MKSTLRAALAAALLAGCHSSTPAPEPAPSMTETSKPAIALERTPCLGSCPVYTVSLFRSGRVRFDGRKYVEHGGVRSAQISSASVDSLLSELSAAGYYGFDDRYAYGAPACGRYATDLPSAIMTVDDGKRTKRIEHDHGCTDAPAALARLENRIDEVAGSARWTGR